MSKFSAVIDLRLSYRFGLTDMCLLFSAPCFAAKAESWHGRDADFSRYKT